MAHFYGGTDLPRLQDLVQQASDLTPYFSQARAGTLTERMNIDLVSVSALQVVGSMPVAGNTQPLGLLHGGASAVLAETLGSVGATAHAAPLGKYAVGIELTVSHHTAVRSGVVTGTATALKLGGTLASYEIHVVDDADRPVCTARLTCLLRDFTSGG